MSTTSTGPTSVMIVHRASARSPRTGRLDGWQYALRAHRWRRDRVLGLTFWAGLLALLGGLGWLVTLV
ncbi:MAG: hypothetical protein ACRDSZ_16885 [Pseudonocardiaceae bacterium]